MVTRNDDGTLTVIFRDGTTAKFKQPNDIVLGMALAASRKDPNGSADVLIDNCLVSGDKSKLKNTVAYLRQIQEAADDVFGKVPASLSWTEGLAYVEFMDAKMCILKPATRAVYGEAQVKARQNPLNYIRHILSACWESGDDDIKKGPGYLLGFSEIVDEYLEYTGEKLGN